jgi:hypothetical protein
VLHTTLRNSSNFWHAASCVVYFVICLFDFVVVPSFIGLTREDYHDLVPVVKNLPPEVALSVVNREPWYPLTLHGGGLFHLAMGSIITGSVVSRHRKLRDSEE